MMRSMFSGVSGLRTHQAKMDVIGNNIANVNTVGYKGSNVNFQQVFSQTVRGAGSPQSGRGGTNPQQVGLGVTVGSMDVSFTKGSTQRTDNPTDLMIDGNGFFVVTNDVNNQNKFYTRAGNFTTDKLGNLVTAGGYKVLGEDGQPIVIDKTETVIATQTDKVEIGSNINSEEDIDEQSYIAYTTAFDVFDSLGNTHTIMMNVGEKLYGNDGSGQKFEYRNIQFSNPQMTSDVGELTNVNVTSSTDASGDVKYEASGSISDNSYYAQFDESGNFLGIVSGSDMPNLNEDSGEFNGSPGYTDLQLDLSIPGANDINLSLYDSTLPVDQSSFANLTHFAGSSDAKGKAVTGLSAGVLDTFNISAAGEVIGSFTNGEKKTLGVVQLADFDNNAGLQKVGSNLFVDTPNSGTPKYGVPGSGSFGSLATGALEMSNVDLSQQFTEMITTQRGFQANSRVITTTDEMLQELVNLKR